MTRTPAATPMAERWLSVAADAGAGSPDPSQRLDDFRRFLLLWTAGRSCLWVAVSPTDALVLAPLALLGCVAGALAFLRPTAHLAPRLGLAVVLAQAIWNFPLTPNHLFLELVCLACLSLVRRDVADDAAHGIAALRWITALVLFHTGLQKVFYGLYFHGEFLALMAGSEERFGRVFHWLLSEAERARLAGLDASTTGAGPYRVSGPLAWAGNAVWIAEMTLPVLMLAARSRVVGALGGLALMVGIQVAALELGFALLFVNLLLLFLPGRWNARLLPVTAAAIVLGIAAAAGLVPGHPMDWNLM